MLPAGHEESVEAAGFSRHLPLAATGSIDGKLIIWDCGTFTERGVCQHDDVSEVQLVCLGSSNSWLLCTGAAVDCCCINTARLDGCRRRGILKP
jgi:WD40 repeat protein